MSHPIRSVVRYDPLEGRLCVTERGLNSAWRILVIGAGGTGSEVVDAFARLDYALEHLGHPGLTIVLQDADTVSAANVGRQRFVPSDVGQPKAQVLADRYAHLLGVSIRPHLSMAVTRHFKEFTDFDLVVTCVDRAAVRVKIHDYFRSRRCETLWMDLGNGQFDGQCVLGHLGIPGGPRIPNVLDLFPGIQKVKDQDQPSCSVAEALQHQMIFVNRWMADAAASLLVQLLTQGQMRNHGAFIDMRGLKVSPLIADTTTWEMISPGYVQRSSERRSSKKNRSQSQELAA